MNTHQRNLDEQTPSARRRISRRALLAAAVLTAVAVVAWIGFAAGRDAHRRMPSSVADAAHPAAGDPHAGHDMEDTALENGLVVLARESALGREVPVVAAELGPLHRTIRTTGTVAYDESRLTIVSPRFAGFVERLHVDFTGQRVRRGQPLLEIYSPELVAAQEELLAAIRLRDRLSEDAAPHVVSRAAGLIDAGRRRLLLWDVSAAQVAEIERAGRARRALTLHASASGFVVEKMVEAGQAVEMGMPLYRLADLTSVWVETDIYEQDLRFVRVGNAARVEIAAYPGEQFTGRVSYVYPEVSPETRTARVRVVLANSGGRLKPGMYATVEIDAPVSEDVVFVPRDAVMHSGTHAMVFVEEAAGRYRAREVQVGADVGGRTQILSGLSAGERVVSRANFLLDSDSRLNESMGAMPGMNH